MVPIIKIKCKIAKTLLGIELMASSTIDKFQPSSSFHSLRLMYSVTSVLLHPFHNSLPLRMKCCAKSKPGPKKSPQFLSEFWSELCSSVSINKFGNTMKSSYAFKIVPYSLLSCYSFAARNEVSHPCSLIYYSHNWIKIVNYRQICDKVNADFLPLLHK